MCCICPVDGSAEKATFLLLRLGFFRVGTYTVSIIVIFQQWYHFVTDRCCIQPLLNLLCKLYDKLKLSYYFQQKPHYCSEITTRGFWYPSQIYIVQ